MSNFDVAASFLFTWLVGLGLPSIIRYIGFRRPLEKYEAMGWAFGLSIAELIFFILLGSASKSHAVLILIGIAAYRLLQASQGPWDRYAGDLPVPGQPSIKTTNKDGTARPISGSPIDSSSAAISCKLFKLLRSRSSGWFRLGVVVLVTWFAVVGIRLGYEMGGYVSSPIFVNSIQDKPNYQPVDFDRLEYELQLGLGAPAAVARYTKLQAETATAPDDSIARKLDEQMEQEMRGKAIKLAGILETFHLPALTPDAISGLIRELAVSEKQIADKPQIARQLLQLKELRGAIKSDAVLNARFFGYPSPSRTVEPTAIAAVALGPVIALLFIWIVASWVVRGFHKQM